MAFSDEQKEKIIEIDRIVKLVLSKKGSDAMLIMLIPEIIGRDTIDFLAAAEEGELGFYCKKYSGFHKMMKVLTNFAREI